MHSASPAPFALALLCLLQGRPKGVEISHGGLRDLIAFFVEKMDLGAYTLCC